MACDASTLTADATVSDASLTADAPWLDGSGSPPSLVTDGWGAAPRTLAHRRRRLQRRDAVVRAGRGGGGMSEADAAGATVDEVTIVVVIEADADATSPLAIELRADYSSDDGTSRYPSWAPAAASYAVVGTLALEAIVDAVRRRSAWACAACALGRGTSAARRSRCSASCSTSHFSQLTARLPLPPPRRRRPVAP